MAQTLANAKVGEMNLQRMNVLEQPQPMKSSFEMGMQEHSSVWPGLVTPACNLIHPVRQKLHRFKGRLNKLGKSCLQMKVKRAGECSGRGLVSLALAVAVFLDLAVFSCIIL